MGSRVMRNIEWLEALGLIFIVSTMLTAGLEVTRAEVSTALRHRSLTTRILVANFIIVPLLGVLLLTLFDMQSDYAVGFLLMASAPGGFHAIQFSGKVKTHLALATSTLFLLSGLALVITPLLARTLLNVTHPISWRYFELTLGLGLGQVLPLLVGFGLTDKTPLVADKLKTPLVILSNVAFLSYVVATGASNREALALMGRRELAAFVILIFASLLVGWWAGGPDRGARQVTAASTSLRNGSICLVIAVAGMPDSEVKVAIIVYMALMIPINTIFLFYRKFRQARRLKREQQNSP
jgi:BASS family bile acid:Na+ symporter